MPNKPDDPNSQPESPNSGILPSGSNGENVPWGDFAERLAHHMHELEVLPPPEQVTQLIELEDKKSQRLHDTSRMTIFYVTVIIIAAFVTICILAGLFLTFNKAEQLTTILTHLFALLAGAFGGYGLGSKKTSSDN